MDFGFLQLYQTYPEAVEVPEHDNLIVALDLLSGLTEGIGSRIEPLVMSSNLMVNIAHCIRVSHSGLVALYSPVNFPV